jgi:NADH-quinone oxidoreductase subunit N
MKSFYFVEECGNIINNNNENLISVYSGSDSFLTSFFCLSGEFYLMFSFIFFFLFFLCSIVLKKLNITHLNVLCLIFLGNLFLNVFHPVFSFFSFSSMFYCDDRIFFFKIFFALVAFFFVVLIRQRVKMDFLSYDFFFLIFLVLLTMQWLFSVNNFIYFYLLIELISLAAYALASFDVFSAKSTEAGLKYFVVGSLASIFLLFAICFFY